MLCIDNAEHLLAVLAPLLERLLDAAPDLHLVVTSRERIALDLEVVRVLAPLPVPADADRATPAVRLFVDRASGVDRAALTDDDIAVVAQVCRRLDGLPLAIELGAALAGTFGVTELAAHLGERLDLLAGGRRTAATRHRTLRAVVDWSYELLTGDEATLFARLATFPDTFRLDQVQSICSDDVLPREMIAPLLARLIDQSLVQSGQGRCWLLETLRTYAGERLERSGQAHGLRGRHAGDTARRLSTLNAKLWTPDEAGAVTDLDELVADLHAAWAHASRHDPDLAVQLSADVYDFAYLRQRLDLLAWGAEAVSWGVDHPAVPRARAAAAALAWADGRLDEAWTHAVAAGDDDPAAARALSQSGNLAMFRGRTNEAMERFAAAAALHRLGGEDVRALLDDISVEQARTYAGRPDVARHRMAELVAGARRVANPSAQCWAHYVLGEATEDPDRALAAYATAIEHGRQVDCELLVMLARGSSIAILASHGPAARALREFDEILGHWEALGNELTQWWTLLQLVLLLERVAADADAAILAGAVLAARDRQAVFTHETERLDAALARVRDRMGAAADAALEAGTGLSRAAAIAHARQAIRSARHRSG